MTAYAFWNNKGGVGKSFLSFVAATEYARTYPDTDVYVIDLCPQANVSEMLLLNSDISPNTDDEMSDENYNVIHKNYDVINKLIGQTPRATVAGYLEARLNSPFEPIKDVSPYVYRPADSNKKLPVNLLLVCGDYLLEILSEAIRQTSQLAIPVTAWKQVLSWIKDLTNALRKRSGNRDALFIIDCNPSFAIYTQLALAAAENLVVPFTPDDSSRRAVENVVALLHGHGIGDPKIEIYARINFANRAKEEGLDVPKLHTFVSNRVTLYRGRASKAFEAVNESIKKTLNVLYKKYRQIYAIPKESPSERFIEVPDYHSACVVMTVKGIPLYNLQAGPNKIGGKQIQLNPEPLERYRAALTEFVSYL
ncbi:ParA family protein [Candidatus Poribacteria bacterium]|nr:ParA family protein [Candidatus Poribacteria bacterium]